MRQRLPSAFDVTKQQLDSRGHKRKKGRPGWLGFFRKLFWSWWIWIAAATAAELAGHGNMAASFAVTAFLFYLLAPRERIPVCGLESDFPLLSREFLATMVGATGVSSIPNNKVTIL